jgi:hypothetical protein
LHRLGSERREISRRFGSAAMLPSLGLYKHQPHLLAAAFQVAVQYTTLCRWSWTPPLCPRDAAAAAGHLDAGWDISHRLMSPQRPPCPAAAAWPSSTVTG